LVSGLYFVFSLSLTMSWRGLVKFTSAYLFVLFFIHLGIFYLIKYRQRNFDQIQVNRLIYSSSPFHSSPVDLCQRSFAKDPYTQNYYKIYLYCSDSAKSTNTIDLDAVGDKTVKGVVAEFARIVKFDALVLLGETSWVCISAVDDLEVDFNSLAKEHDILSCYANKDLAKKLYQKRSNK